MSMNNTYLNAIADNGNPITHIGLVDDLGAELSGGSPAYARQPVTWTAASTGDIAPDSDLTFDIPPGTTVAGWRGYDALSAGNDYGGQDLTQESFVDQGQYTLLAGSTGINHNAV